MYEWLVILNPSCFSLKESMGWTVTEWNRPCSACSVKSKRKQVSAPLCPTQYAAIIHLHGWCSSIQTAVTFTIAPAVLQKLLFITDNSVFYTDRCFLTKVWMSCFLMTHFIKLWLISAVLLCKNAVWLHVNRALYIIKVGWKCF